MNKFTSFGYLFDEELRGKAGAVRSTFFSKRLEILKFVLLVSFGLMVIRLFWLQVVFGEHNRVLSDENRILARSIQAPRGVIRDRSGVILVQNVPIFQKLIDECLRESSSFEPSEFDAKRLCPAYKSIKREEAVSLEAQGLGNRIRTLVGRHYVFGEEIAHLVGYVSEADQQDLENHPDYLLGDLVGKMGVEYVYEDVLHGKPGAELVEIDASGKVSREVSHIEPASGIDLTLFADVRLQKKAYELLDGREGAVVALDPRDGSVLTLVSSPSFDPNDVVISLEREDQPFFNRTLGGAYPPGSVFKVVTATAGLEEGKIDASTEIEDTGEIIIGPYRYGNWYFDQYGRKEGSLTIVEAIKRSNDIFFYRVGGMVGANALADWAKRYGYGEPSGIDLPGEIGGIVPSPEWKENQKGEKWFLGNTYHFAIGQSDMTATPLQVAVMTAAAATNKVCAPRILNREHLIESLVSANEFGGENCHDLGVGDKNRKLVHDGMVAVCSPGGTAFPFFNFQVNSSKGIIDMPVACKTGTAEFGDPQDRTHAWFTVYAPADNPEIVVTVLLPKAGEGSYEAAPVAKDFLQYYFEEVSMQ